MIPLLLDPAETAAALNSSGLDVTNRLAETVCISLARPFTSALAYDLPLLAGARLAYVCHAGAARLIRIRVPGVRNLSLGFDEATGGWDGAPRPRPIDVAFIGHGGGDRLRLLAAAAGELDRYRTEIHISRLGEPELGYQRASVLRDSQLVIVASPGEGNAVDSLELAQAAATGAVALVVDPGDLAPYEPGEHVLVTTAGGLPAAISRALAAPARLDRIRACARALASEHPDGDGRRAPDPDSRIPVVGHDPRPQTPAPPHRHGESRATARRCACSGFDPRRTLAAAVLAWMGGGDPRSRS